MLSAIREAGRKQDVRVSLITSRNLDPAYRTGLYPIHDVLPPLRHRATYRTPLHWGLSRVAYYLKRESAFLRWVESNPCEGVHFQEYAPWLAPRHFRRLRAQGKSLFFTVHNIHPHKYLPGVPETVYHAWSRAAWRSCNALFVHTEDLRESLSAFLGKGHPPIFVVPHGVWSVGGDAGAEAGVEESTRRRLLFFGVVRPNKGLHVLLRAMEELDDCTLTVAGAPENPRYQEQVRTLAARLPEGRVKLIERFVEDEEVAGLFGRHGLLILPYTSFASQSGALHDALAYGLPVVATDVGALGGSVRRWGVGRVAPPDDPAALAGAIQEMLEPRHYREAISAVDRAKRDLSWTRAAEITVEAYLSARSRDRAAAR
jgi:glycosyltransferase involved in cell wall biosynthesis